VANAAKVKANIGTRPSKWCKPPPQYFKVNVDGSFHHDSHSGSIGAVIRDAKGDFVAASTLYLPHIASPAVSKAMAMKEGLSLANCLGCSNVIMESDSIETIEACTGEETWWGEPSAIFADCVDSTETT
jgi:ribonuclease HI